MFTNIFSRQCRSINKAIKIIESTKLQNSFSATYNIYNRIDNYHATLVILISLVVTLPLGNETK